MSSAVKMAFVFPGQGSQKINMLAPYREDPLLAEIVDEALAEANSVLGFDLGRLIAEGPEEDLNQTVNTQPAMLAAGVAVWRGWLALGGEKPQWLAGHSLGEYSALVAAESLSFTDALRLVRFRAEVMQNAVPQGEGSMAAILGVEDEVVQRVCREAAQNQVVEPVNYNAPGQVVIAGHLAAVERAVHQLKACGAKRAILLPVSVPSHCELMRGAAAKFADYLSEVSIQPPKIPLLHNATLSLLQGADAIRTALAEQLYSPVRWVDTIRYFVQQGVQCLVECGPGKVLLSLNKRIAEQTQSVALFDAASLKAVRTSE